VITIENNISVEFSESTYHGIPRSECDINITPVMIDFTVESCSSFLQVLNSFISAVPKKECEQPSIVNKPSDALEALIKADPGLGALLWLEKQQSGKKEEDDKINYRRLVSLLKEHHLSKQLSSSTTLDSSRLMTYSAAYNMINPSSSSRVVGMATINDDDIDFDDQDPSDEQSKTVNESDFFDAVEGNAATSQRVRFHPHLTGESSATPSIRLPPRLDDSTTKLIPLRDSLMRVRLASLAVTFSDPICSANKLCLVADEIIVSHHNEVVSSPNNPEIAIPEQSVTTISLVMKEFQIYEKTSRSVVPWLSFYHQESDALITYPQDIDIEVKLSPSKDLPSCRETFIHIKLEPVVLSLQLSKINQWTAILTKTFSNLQLTADTDSPFATAFTLEISEMHVIFHPEEKSSSSMPTTWDEFTYSLDLDRFPDRWDKMSTMDERTSRVSFDYHLSDHLIKNHSKGGFHISASDLSVSYNSTRSHESSPNEGLQGLSSSSFASSIKNSENQGLSLSQLQFAMYMKSASETAYRQTVFLSAFHNPEKPTSKVYIRHHASSSLSSSFFTSSKPSQEDNKLDFKAADDLEGRALYEDDSLPEPRVESSNLLHLYAYRIAVDVKQRELNALITLTSYYNDPNKIAVSQSDSNLSDKSSSSSASASASMKRSRGPSSSSFGILFHSEIATIRVSENSKLYNGSASAANEEEGDKTMCLCLSVINPLIKVLSNSYPSQQSFFSIQAEDLSIFEFTNQQVEESFSQSDFKFKPHLNHLSRRARYGSEAHYVPFIHRTTLHSKSGKWDLQYRDAAMNTTAADISKNQSHMMLSPGQLWDHTFRLQMLLSEEQSLDRAAADVVKFVSIHMSFQDVTLRYDPKSSWFINIVELMTPLSPHQIIQRRGLTSSSSSNDLLAPTASSPKKPKNLFEITKANIRVRKCLIDYCCEQAPSRLLFSVGLLTMSTTVLSNTPKFSVKFTVRDISLHITNRLQNRGELEQSPLDPDGHRSELANKSSHALYGKAQDDWLDFDTFLDQHLFVQLLTLDYQESLITFHDDAEVMNQSSSLNSSAISLKINIGLCCIYACIDSMAVLSDTMLSWWTDFKSMIAKSAKRKAKQVEMAMPGIDSEASESSPVEAEYLAPEASNFEMLVAKRNGLTLATLGDEDDYLNENRRSAFMSKSFQNARTATAAYPEPSVATVKPLIKPQPTKSNMKKPVSVSTANLPPEIAPSQKMVNWMENIQKQAFIPPPASLMDESPPIRPQTWTRVSSAESNQQKQLQEAVLGDVMVNSGYYGRAQPPRPPSPEYEARWIPEYGDEDDLSVVPTSSSSAGAVDKSKVGSEVDLWDDVESVVSSSDDDDEEEAHHQMTTSMMMRSSRLSQSRMHIAGANSAPDSFHDVGNLDNDEIDFEDEDQNGDDNPYPMIAYEEIEGVESGGRDSSAVADQAEGEDEENDDGHEEHSHIDLDRGLHQSWQSNESRGLLYGNHSSFFDDSPLVDDSNVSFDELDDVIDQALAEEESYPFYGAKSSSTTRSKAATEFELDDFKPREVEGEENAYDRFGPVDGVHNALQINIGQSISFRQAGASILIDRADTSFISNHDHDQSHDMDDPSSSSSSEASQRQVDTIIELMDNMIAQEAAPEAEAEAEDGGIFSTIELDSAPTEALQPSSTSSAEATTNLQSDTSNIFSAPYHTAGNADDDFERAWRDAYLPSSSKEEYRATWYVDPSSVAIDQMHASIPLHQPSSEAKLPEVERSLSISTMLQVKASVRLRLFGGADWSDSPQPVVRVPVSETSNPQASVKKVSKQKHVNHQENNPILKDLLTSNPQAPKQTPASKKAGARELFERQPFINDGSSNNRKSRPFILRTRDTEDMLDVSATNLSIELRVYDLEQYLQRKQDDQSTATATINPPYQRLTFKVQDTCLSFQRYAHRRKKVLGWWRIPGKTRDMNTPMLQAILVGYSTKDINGISSTSKKVTADSDNLEHRVAVSILPLRCYLNPYLVDFLKDLANRQTTIDKKSASRKAVTCTASADKAEAKETTSSHLMFFQMITIRAVDIKIDYAPAGIDLRALHAGDYLQLLNLFPLQGLTITLTKIRLTGISGLTALLERMIAAWVEDIYQNQLHRVISGTIPFRSLANISSDLQELVLIPMNQRLASNPRANVAREVSQKTSGLIRTVTTEALQVTQKLTMLVARGIAELASNDQPLPDPRRIQNSTRKVRFEELPSSHEKIASSRITRQPNGLSEGLAKAYESMRREVSSAAESVIAIPIREYQRTGSSKHYVKTVVRALPVAVLRPIAGAAEGVSYTLLGLRNLIDPNSKFEEEDIWEVEK
jgi:hypothetical protein